MMMGPAPMIMIEAMSVRLGIGSPGGAGGRKSRGLYRGAAREQGLNGMQRIAARAGLKGNDGPGMVRAPQPMESPDASTSDPSAESPPRPDAPHAPHRRPPRWRPWLHFPPHHALTRAADADSRRDACGRPFFVIAWSRVPISRGCGDFTGNGCNFFIPRPAFLDRASLFSRCPPQLSFRDPARDDRTVPWIRSFRTRHLPAPVAGAGGAGRSHRSPSAAGRCRSSPSAHRVS